LNEGIIYPQGFSPVVAFASLIFGYLPPVAVFYVTGFFNVLIILGAYFLGKTVDSGRWRIGLSLAFIFAFVAAWPKYMTWGSNAFVASFPLFFICLSLCPVLVKNGSTWKNDIAVGVLFGFLAVLHLQVFEALLATLFVLWIYSVVRHRNARYARPFHNLGIIGVSMIVLSPFVLRQIAVYSYPLHNTGVPLDVDTTTLRPDFSLVITGLSQLFENVAINPTLIVFSLALFAISVPTLILRWRRCGSVQTQDLARIGLGLLLGELLIFLLAAISPNNLPFYAQPLLLYFPFYFFVAAATHPLYEYISSVLSKRLKITGARLRQSLAFGIALVLVISMYSPFLYQSIFNDVSSLQGSYLVFGVTTQQDLELLLWMRNSLSSNEVILINNFQSGAFIPSIASQKAIFPSFGSSQSISYQRLITLLEANTVNATVYELMKSFNITGLYVGGGVSPWDGGVHRFDPYLFLGNPHFKTVKKFGNAYLFQVGYHDTSKIFFDDFEHEEWNDYGWKSAVHGYGLGNISLSEGQYGSSKSLKMTSEATYTLTESSHMNCFSRPFFLQDDYGVTLSFSLTLAESLHGKDTFTVLVSDVDSNRTLVISNPGGIFENYENTLLMATPAGLMEFDLSKEWDQKFFSPLPNILVLTFAVYDFDGIVNVACVDDITLTSVSPN
jgi:hypothetical protein